MASDSVTQRYADYRAGLDIVEPQIRGLINKLNDDISAELKTALSERLEFLQDRRDKINASIAAQDAAEAALQILEDDGFPAVPNMEIPQHLIDELLEEDREDDAARGGFEALPMASGITIDLGTSEDKP